MFYPFRRLFRPRPQPYAEAREEIAKKIYNEKLTKAVEDYADKLRAVSEVKIYSKGQLNAKSIA